MPLDNAHKIIPVTLTFFYKAIKYIKMSAADNIIFERNIQY